jgi:aspartate/methionine/tyrosine aminotransferase
LVQIQPFHSIELSRMARSLAAEGRSIIHMEFGQPSTSAPVAALEAAKAAIDLDPMGYWESAPLCERIARHYGETYGVEVRPEQVLLTCGASPALVLALASAFSPGDRVAVARPGYVAYRNTLRALHMEPVELTCGADTRFQLSAAMIRDLDPAPAGLIIASPANPTGTIIPSAELGKICRLASDREIRIISDEIYHGLSFGDPAETVLRFTPGALVVNSFSKYFSMPGWRLGWLIAPDDLLQAAKARIGNLFLTPPTISQHAALAAFDCIPELERHLDTYRCNRDIMLARLPALGLKEIAPPDGAFYIYASVGHLTNDSLSFARRMLMETGVAAATGIDFDPHHGRRYIRFSFAIATHLVEDAMDRLAQWLPLQHNGA